MRPSGGRRLRSLALLALFAAGVASAAPRDFSLDGRVEVVVDPAAHPTLEALLADPRAGEFRPVEKAVFNGGYTRDVHWFRVALPEEAAPGPWLLEIGYPLLDEVDAWLPLAGGQWDHVRTGDQRPFADRAIAHRNFVLPLSLEADAARTVYLRVDTQSSLELPLHLWTPEAFFEKTQDEQYLLGFYYGIMLVMALYNLFVFGLVRDISYLYYILYIAASVLLQGSLNGLSAQYLFGNSPYWTNLAVPLSLSATVAFATLFTHSFLDTARNLPRLNKVLWGLFGLTVITGAAVFVMPYSKAIVWTSVLAAAMTFLFTGTGVRALLIGVRAARFFMLAWSVFLASILMRVLLGFGLMPPNLLTMYCSQIGGALEVALLALALADRITLERQEKERLARASAVATAATEAKSEFLARMSHEIRTPINAVTGFTDLALRAEGEVQRLDYLRQIRAASRSLLTLINDILDMSRVEAGKLSLATQDFRLAPLLAAVRELFAAQAAEKGVSLEVTAEADVPDALRGDPVRIEQVLVNLVANALKFTERGSVTLKVSCEHAAPEEARVRFTVTDTGIGIPAPQRVRLFEPFSQGDESITRRYGGTGLGLAICRQLVDLMGGTIGVDSTVGEGSTFYFSLRLGRASGALRDTNPEGAPIASFPGARVLVVEDNALNQRLAQEMLVSLGASVTLAGHGGEALEAVQREGFDVVLMDVQMPEMDGLEATRRIRLLPAHRNLTIIAMTAHALSGSREQCVAAGMNDFLGKPVTLRGLAAVLGRWLPAGPPIAAPEPAVAGLPDLLPGIRVGQALRRLGNDDLLRTSLAEFCRDYAGAADALAQALASGDMGRASRLAHTLKGVASNLSMPDLEAAARAAEEQLFSSGRLREGALDSLRSALATVVESCASVAPPAPPAVSLDDAGLRSALAELAALVERKDFASSAVFARCQSALASRFGADAVEALARPLAAFDFSAARAPLAALTSRLSEAA